MRTDPTNPIGITHFAPAPALVVRASHWTMVNPRSLKWGAAGLAHVLMLAAMASGQATIINLCGPPDREATQSHGLSENGLVVAGFCGGLDPGLHAFRWTAAGGTQDLGVLPGGTSVYTEGISGDGSTVVGWGDVRVVHPDYTEVYYHGFRWTAADGMQDIGDCDGTAYAANYDGSVVVGSGVCGPSNIFQAFRWTAATGKQSLGFLPGQDPDRSYSIAKAVNGDGSVVVGSCGLAFRWTETGGMQELGRLETTYAIPLYIASSISNDGSAIAGWWGNNIAGNTVPFQAFRWRAGFGMQSLGSLPGTWVYADTFVNADGSTVVGSSGNRAFVWTEATGMVDLNTYLPALGVDLTGWRLDAATGVSADGRVVGGYGINPNGGCGGAWVATLPAVLLPCLTVDGIQNTASCPSGTATFSATASAGAGTGPFTYQWQWQPAPGAQWVDISDGQNTDPAGGPIQFVAQDAQTATVTVGPFGGLDTLASHWEQRCLVTNTCGSVTSGPATLTICRADINCDGFMDGIDYDTFNNWFEDFDPEVQIQADYNGDGFVDGIDYDQFNNDFERGC